MQVKVLLSTILFSTIVLTSVAQQRGKVTVPATHKNNADTLEITKKAAAKAENKSASNAKEVLATTATDAGYAHVPLAGEKSYFGDKNEFVTDFVRKYMELNNRTLSCVQNNSATPFSLIDNILEEKKMPKELKYLAVIESALNHKAVSHAGAVGPWQLMSTTAKMMGLQVTRKNDERTDWSKSTNAAIKYLDLLYSQLNDWLLVIAAYNSGPTPVQKAIDKTGSHNFWDIKEYLPKETQGHVLAFIATATIFENLSKFISLGSIPVDFKFSKDKDDEVIMPMPSSIKEAIASKGTSTSSTSSTFAATTPVAIPVKKLPTFTDDELKNMSIVRIDKAIGLDLIAFELGIDGKLLNRWNPDYDQFVYHNNYPTPYYKLRLPKDKLDLFLQKKDVLLKKSKAI